MPTFYLPDERHTLASALRCELEALATGGDVVACTLMHPLDDHLRVVAPSEAMVRAALLAVKERVARSRREIEERPPRPTARARRARAGARAESTAGTGPDRAPLAA